MQISLRILFLFFLICYIIGSISDWGGKFACVITVFAGTHKLLSAHTPLASLHLSLPSPVKGESRLWCERRKPQCVLQHSWRNLLEQRPSPEAFMQSSSTGSYWLKLCLQGLPSFLECLPFLHAILCFLWWDNMFSILTRLRHNTPASWSRS